MPEVFISYRQTSDDERKRVRVFAARLRSSGIRVILDQFLLDAKAGGPPEDWAKWSTDQANQTERVIIIGSESWFLCYDGKQPPGTGLGAACEARNLRRRIYRTAGINEDIRVVIFDEADARHISADLELYHRFHADRDFDDILRWLRLNKLIDSSSSSNRESQQHIEDASDTKPSSPKRLYPSAGRLIGRNKIFRKITECLQSSTAKSILLYGPEGTGKGAILNQFCLAYGQTNESPLRHRFKSLIHNLSSLLDIREKRAELLNRILSNLGRNDDYNLDEKSRMDKARDLVRGANAIVLIQDADLIICGSSDWRQFISSLIHVPSSSKFILSASNYSEIREIDCDMECPVPPLDASEIRKLIESFGKQIGLKGPIEDEKIIQIVNSSLGRPGAIRAALREYKQSGGFRVRPLSAATLRIAATIEMLPSRRTNILESIVGDSNALISFQEELKLLGISTANQSVVPLFPNTLMNEVRIFLDNSLKEKASVYESIERWALDFVTSVPEWERCFEQHQAVLHTIIDLRSVVNQFSSYHANSQPLSDDLQLKWLSLLELVHRSGTWQETITVLEHFKLSAHSPRTRMKADLLLQRHWLYRSDSRNSSAILNDLNQIAESARKLQMPDIEIEAKLRLGQALKHRNPENAIHHLRYVFENGSLRHFLVAVGFFAEIHLSQGELRKADEILSAAQNIQCALDSPYQRIRAHHFRLQGEIAALESNFEIAARCFSAARNIAQNWGADKRLDAWCLLGLALSCGSHQFAELAATEFNLLSNFEVEKNRVNALSSFLTRAEKQLPPCILIFGGPAAGKTTLRDNLAMALVRSGIPAVRLGIEESQRRCYPAPSYDKTQYEYTSVGALVLHNRNQQIEHAYEELSKQLQMEIRRGRVAILEFAFPRPDWVFRKLGVEQLASTTAVFVSTATKKRLERNEGRKSPPSHVPPEIVRQFDSPCTTEVRELLESLSVRLIEVDGESSPLELTNQVLDRLRQGGALAEYLQVTPSTTPK